MKQLHSVFLNFPLWVFLFITPFYVVYGQAENDIISASQYYKKGDSLLMNKKYEESIQQFEKALFIYKKEKVWKKVADCYNKLSENQRGDQKLEKSIQNSKIALKICNKYLVKNDEQKSDAYQNMGFYYRKKKDFNKALFYFNKVLEIRQRLFPDGHPELATSYHNIGIVFYQTAKYEKAIQYHQKALHMRQDLFPKGDKTIGMSYNNIGIVFYETAKYERALEYLLKGVAMYIKTLGHNDVLVGSSYGNIGAIYDINGDYKQALEYYKKSLMLTIKNDGKDHLYTGYGYANMGLTYFKIMQYEEALNCYQKALSIFDKKEFLRGQRVIYLNKGILLHDQGEYEKALQYFNMSLNMTLELFEVKHRDMATAYRNIGSVFFSKGEDQKALEYYIKSSQISKALYGENHYDIGTLYGYMGDLYGRKKENENALKYYKKSLDVYKSLFGEYHLTIARSYASIGLVYSEMICYEDALYYYKKGLKNLQDEYGNEHPLITEMYLHIADVYYEQQQYEKAIIYYDKGLFANTKNKNNTNFDVEQYYNLQKLLEALNGKAKVLQSQYKKYKDLKYLYQSVAIYDNANLTIDQIRRSYQNYKDKVAFAKQVKRIYTNAIKTHLLIYRETQKMKALEKAFYYSERSKANTLKELLNDSYAKDFIGLPLEVIETGKKLKTDRAFYQGQIVKEFSNEITDTIKIKGFENELFNLNRKEDSLTKVLEKEYPKYYQLKYQNKIITVSDIQQRLDEKTTLLEFFTLDSITYAFIVSKKTISLQELPISKITERVEEFRESIISKNTVTFKENAHTLYNKLIAPVSGKFVGDQLIVIPDGPLWHLNFELLLTRKEDSNNPALLPYLLKDYAVTYANSANLLFTPFDSNLQSEVAQECLAFSFSDSTQAKGVSAMSLVALRNMDNDLPGTRKEIKAISKIIDGKYYYGSQAVEANFKKNADKYNILHLALHGHVDNEHPENSTLHFTKSNDTIEDNMLYSHELFALDIPAELTVLSACNTGTGKIASGEGIMSLGNAFQYAGTKSLLLTSWEVSDQTTPRLMESFYANLKEGMNKAKALQQAKLDYLAIGDINRMNPVYWGGFYLVGDSSPIPFKMNTGIYWTLGLGVLMISFLIMFWWRRKKRGKLVYS
ncbi:CHAT domain-containing protein [Aquimarina macrocephali]|uniref:CHAT domain-containing protein n=1 Tax=Aquimarina macrocephali TaxID=666563 RepID=UPI003F66D6B5